MQIANLPRDSEEKKTESSKVANPLSVALEERKETHLTDSKRLGNLSGNNFIRTQKGREDSQS